MRAEALFPVATVVTLVDTVLSAAWAGWYFRFGLVLFRRALPADCRAPHG